MWCVNCFSREQDQWQGIESSVRKWCWAGKPLCVASFRKVSQELQENHWNDYLTHIWVNNANQERFLHEERVSEMLVFLCLGCKVRVPFSVSYRRKASSQQEWKALMANLAWESRRCWDGQRRLTWEQWLKTVTGSLRQKTATCGHLCCIWSGTLAFPYRLKSVLPFPASKIFSWKPEQAAYGMKELLWLVFIEQLVFSDVSFSSFPPTFFFLPLFWCSDT